MFEKASRLKLRFNSSKGNLSVEDLWDVGLEELDTMAQALDSELEKATTKSFIKRTRKSPQKVLQFEIIKHVINTRLEEAEAAKVRADNKAKREEIMGLIAEKQRQETAGKSIEELQAELAALEE
jgi:hypothetical protein